MTDETEPTPAKKPIWKRWWFIALAAIVALFIVPPMFGAGSPTPTTTTAAPTAGETTTTAADETTTTTTPAEETTTTAAPAITTTTTVPATPTPAFGSGTFLVGDEIEPGLYSTLGESCYWARLSGLGGTIAEIIANDFTEGRAIVDIDADDEAFESECDWYTLDELRTFDLLAAVDAIGDGAWLVGEQVTVGRWSSDGGNLCYWERLSGFSGEFGDIITNSISDGRQIVEIAASDAGFTSAGCADWTPLG